jgi:hypothetical protein
MRISQFPIRTSIAMSKKMHAIILAMSTEQKVSIGEVIRTLLAEALTARKVNSDDNDNLQNEPDRA